MVIRIRLIAILILAGVLAAALALAGPATADPPSDVYRAYAGVGSDTTQGVVDALVGDVPGMTGVIKTLSSYDATPQGGNIQTKMGGPSFLRPDGGVKALSDANTSTPYYGVNITGQVDFARSSSGPAATGTDLTYLPFARDAVSYAYIDSTGRLGKLTTAQLNAAYSANSPYSVNGVAIRPELPLQSSDTRRFFLATIGVYQLGFQVVETNQVENDGTVLTQTGDIIPFSVASFIAQRNGVTTPNTTAPIRLGQANGVAPTKTSNSKLVPNATYYNGVYGRFVYNVVPTAKLIGNLATAFKGTSAKFCVTAAQNIVKKYGFATIGTTCGSTSTTGAYTP